MKKLNKKFKYGKTFFGWLRIIPPINFEVSGDQDGIDFMLGNCVKHGEQLYIEASNEGGHNGISLCVLCIHEVSQKVPIDYLKAKEKLNKLNEERSQARDKNKWDKLNNY